MEPPSTALSLLGCNRVTSTLTGSLFHNMSLRQRQTHATWDTTTGLLIEDVLGEIAILQYLEPFKLRLLHRLHFVLRGLTIRPYSSTHT